MRWLRPRGRQNMYMLSSSRPPVKTDNSQKMNNKTTKDLDKWCNYLTIHKNVLKHVKKVANGGHRSKKEENGQVCHVRTLAQPAEFVKLKSKRPSAKQATD